MSGHIHYLSPRQWVRTKGLLPIVACFFSAYGLAGAYVTYMCATKPDISFRPSSWKEDAPYKYVGVLETRRLMQYSQPLAALDPAIVQLRREIGSYKA